MERWETIKAVERMQEYIDANIHAPITLSALAAAAGYSPWHAARMFKEVTDKAPFEYIRALRLSQAAIMLRNEKSRVIDVAFDFVFNSHEGFTRAFSKQFGVSPKKFSKESASVHLFMPERVRDYYLNLQRGEIKMPNTNTKTVFVQVVERPARKVIIKRGVKATHYFEYCEEVGCDVWEVLSGIKDALYEPIGMWLPQNMIKNSTSEYVQGVEMAADYNGPLPDGYDIMDLPPCQMMVFQGEPFDDEKYDEAIEDLWETMKHYDPQLYGFEWADGEGPRFQLAPMGYRGYIEARPVRQINKA
ncbi:MAG: helix-turn-helix transcriptional regulator [Syntrophomonadaceae bacterium]|nr:helix-turn-helix transcriptional regulator [Syntrophomonadaceae bacterium]